MQYLSSISVVKMLYHALILSKAGFYGRTRSSTDIPSVEASKAHRTGRVLVHESWKIFKRTEMNVRTGERGPSVKA